MEDIEGKMVEVTAVWHLADRCLSFQKLTQLIDYYLFRNHRDKCIRFLLNDIYPFVSQYY